RRVLDRGTATQPAEGITGSGPLRGGGQRPDRSHCHRSHQRSGGDGRHPPTRRPDRRRAGPRGRLGAEPQDTMSEKETGAMPSLEGIGARPAHVTAEEHFAPWFAELVGRLLNSTDLLVGGTPYRFAELETYYHGPQHPDLFAHRDPVQLE